MVASLFATVFPRYVVAKTVTMKNIDEEKMIPLYSELLFETSEESWRYRFTFDNEEVAIITPSGWIKATKPGKTTIRIREKGGRKRAYTIHLTVKKPKGYSISEPGHYFRDRRKIDIKTAKGYTVYYTTDLKFRSRQKIQPGKSKSVQFSTSTKLKVYAVKKGKKVTTAFLNRNGKSGRNYGEYNYYYVPPCGTDLLIRSNRYPTASPQPTAVDEQPTMRPSQSPEPAVRPSKQPQPTTIVSQ